MAITLSANYQKRLGLPGYSSHAFSAEVSVELADMSQIQAETARLYAVLQSSIDHEIQNVGFVPGDTYGMSEHCLSGSNNGANGANDGNSGAPAIIRQLNPSEAHSSGNGGWRCSPRQKDFILKIVELHELDKQQVEDLAHTRFGKGVRLLGKAEASEVISALLEMVNGSDQPKSA